MAIQSLNTRRTFMASTNDVTGDKIQTKVPTDAYKAGWDSIS